MAAASIEDDRALRSSLPAVEEAMGYCFRDKRLLLTALTHRSFCNERNTASGDFDELEWLGDAVLQLAVSSWLFRSATGSRRTSGHLSANRQQFVNAGACESFALQLNLLPFLRIGNAQPVERTKILGDCFEAVLGAVYVDAGGCTDMEPIHTILARVIPSYNHGRQSMDHRQPQWHRHHHHHHHHEQHRHQFRWGGQGAPEPPRPRAEEPRTLMNLAHRLKQMAKRGTGGAIGGAPHSAQFPDASTQVVREFDERLRGFHKNVLQGGKLSFGSMSFVEAFGDDVSRFFAAAATGGKCALLDSVLNGSSMLRKHFSDAPPGSDLVVMAVVHVPPELRLETSTVVEFLLANVLQHEGGSAELGDGNPVLRLIRSTPHGEATITFLSNVVAETAKCLLLSTHHRAVISAGLPPSAVSESRDASRSNPDPAGGSDFPSPEFSPPHDSIFVPGRIRGPPPRGGTPWGGAGPRGRGRGWGRGGGHRGGRGDDGWRGKF